MCSLASPGTQSSHTEHGHGHSGSLRVLKRVHHAPKHCSGVELSLLGHKRVPPDSGYGNDVTTHPLCLQPLKVVDPDHPLAALVRKAQADSPAPTPPSADGSAQPSQAEYAADCEYLAVRLPARGPLHSQPSWAA